MFEQSEITRARNDARTEGRGGTGTPVRTALAALASIAVAGLWPAAAKAQTIIGIPQPVIVMNQPAPVFNPFPGVTVFDGFSSFGTWPTTGFTFGAPIPPGGYYFWPGAPPPALDIGPPIGRPINNGVPIDSPFVVNTNPAPPPQPPAPPAPARPTLPDSAFVQHGPPRIVVKVGRTDRPRAKATTQSKSKPSSKQTASKQNP